MSEHSPIGASGYYRWKECPGSVKLSEGLSGPESAEAIRGQRAHECAALWIKNRSCPKNKFDDLEQEDFDAVEVYYDFVERLIGANSLIKYYIEKKFDLSNVHPGLFGTADFVCYSSEHQKLVVVDYKHGAGLPVEVKDNPQLQYYGAGAVFELNVPIKSIELVIVQPRCQHKDGPIRKWQLSPQALDAFLKQLKEDAIATEAEDAPLNVGEWCRFCPAAAVNCPKLREKSLTLVQEVFAPDAPYNPEKLSEVLRMLPTMESWIRSVKAFAVSEAQGGRVPPGFKIVSKRPMRRWKEGWTGERLAQEFGLKPPAIFDQKVKSPAQVEKIVDKSVKGKVDEFVDKVSSGYKLVEDTDPAPALMESEMDSFTIIEI